MFTRFLLICLFPVLAFAQNSKPIPVLIVDGFSNHDSKQTSLLTQQLLEQSGLFKVDITTVPTDSIQRESWKPEFKKYKVVIQNTNNIQDIRLRWPRSAEEQLEKYVKRGG